MIIVRLSNQSKFEEEYLRNFIFPENSNIYVSPREFLKLEKKLILTNQLVIYYSVGNQSIKTEIDEFIKQLDQEFTLIQLSDETLIAKKIRNKNAKIILRSYFNPNINSSKTYTIPLGYQNGFQEIDNPKIEDRKYIWSFFGQIYSSRNFMVESLKTVQPNYVNQNKSFMSEDIVNPEEVKKVYRDTIFAPCPDGYINPDTFRIMEVLESGCIPIVKSFKSIDYFKYVYGNHPFIVLKDWSEAIEIIKRYTEDKELLNSKQNEITLWYKEYKNKLRLDIKNLIYESKTPQSSIQFKYQRSSRFNLFLRVKFYYWFRLKQNFLFYKLNKLIFKTKNFLKKLVLNEAGI